jgi:hypothetical protein
MVLSGLFREFSPVEEGYSYLPEFPWVIMAVFIPILVAGIFYSVAASKLELGFEDPRNSKP